MATNLVKHLNCHPTVGTINESVDEDHHRPDHVSGLSCLYTVPLTPPVLPAHTERSQTVQQLVVHTLRNTKLEVAVKSLSGSTASTAEKHAAVLGLKAFVLTSPYDVPPWLPEVHMALVKASGEPAPINNTVRQS
ncbi:TPA: hypothetical protein ACH3X1_009966 [Trebouxia sp. C0004]